MATVTTLADGNIVGDNEQQLVTMIVDNQLFGIPILQVQDIVEASKITPVPLAPSAIAGVLNLRGRIVTVIDLRKLMGNHDEVPWDSQMGVTVEYKGDLYTLLVDAIGDVRSLSNRDYDKAPSTMEAEVKRLCSGIYRLRGNLLVVLDVGRILKLDVISATPMLTVEDRKKRKAAAMQEAKGDEGRARQLSALMNDLRAYEAETAEAQMLAGMADTKDDIKSRKKANRARRPVADRWREVLDERERQQGKVVYRMREADEEALEEARRAEIAAEDTAPSRENSVDDSDVLWQSRVRASGPDDRVDAPAELAVPSDEIAAFDDDTDTRDTDDGDTPGVISGWWNKLRGKDHNDAAEAGDEPAAEVGEEPAADPDLKATDDIEAAEAEDPADKNANAAAKPAKSADPAKSARKAKPTGKGKKK